MLLLMTLANLYLSCIHIFHFVLAHLFSNFKPTKKAFKLLCSEVAVDEPLMINLDNFRVLIYALLHRQEIEDLFNRFCKNGRDLTSSDLINFHRTEQQVLLVLN